MDETQKRIDLLEKQPIQKALLKLGIPTMIGMLVSALYNIVDAFFVGQLGTMQTAAVSIVYPLTMVGTGIGLLFGSGAGSYISRLLGKKDYEKVSVCSSIAIFSGTLTISVLVACMLLCFYPLMTVLGATDSTMLYVKAYGMVYIFGLIFNVFNVMMNNLLVAEGNPSFAMIAMLVGGCINLVLDPILIFTCHMGVAGAAAATLVSRFISAVLYLLYLLRGRSTLHISIRKWKPDGIAYGQIFKIGLPVCIFQFLSGGAVSLTNIAARPFGEAAIAAMGIVNRIMSLDTSILYGFLKGYSPLIGYNYGAGNKKRVAEATKTVLLWSTAVNILFGVVCILFSKQFIYLFNQESTAVMEMGRMALMIDAVSFMTLGFQIVIGNYFLSIGKAQQGGILSMCRQGFFFIPLLILFTNIWGMSGLILAQLATDVCATILTVVLWNREKRLQLT